MHTNSVSSTQLTRTSWEPLEEPIPEGQWSYAERNTHTGTTQKP